MKLVRYGAIGQEKPGLIDKSGQLRDLSAHVKDLNGEAYAPASLAKLAKGEAKGKAEAVLAVLDARGLRVTAAQRRQVLACTSGALLDLKTTRAARDARERAPAPR